MGRIAFVFSGQGDQFPGMGRELYENYSAARAVFEMCDSIRPNTSHQCFYGTEDELRETKNTQPCLFAMELAAADVLKENGITPDAVAGFSLGEVTAAAVSGIFDFETGFRLVCKRGELMQSAAEKHDASMAAVVKLSPEKIAELASKYTNVYPVNFNCPDQVTVSGSTEQMAEFYADVKIAGGKAVPLKVKGGFHSPFMNEAADSFALEIKKADINKISVPIYSNITGMPYTDDIVSLLSAQIKSPVQWERTVKNMISDGIDTIIEIGPGKTLSNLIKKIDAEVKVYSVSELDKILSEVKPC